MVDAADSVERDADDEMKRREELLSCIERRKSRETLRKLKRLCFEEDEDDEDAAGGGPAEAATVPLLRVAGYEEKAAYYYAEQSYLWRNNGEQHAPASLIGDLSGKTKGARNNGPYDGGRSQRRRSAVCPQSSSTRSTFAVATHWGLIEVCKDTCPM